jgi:hypothetical protein
MKCPQCRSNIQPKDINEQMQMVCPSCGYVSSLVAGATPAQRPLAPRPAKLSMLELSDGVSFSWRWFQAHHLFLLFFSGIWFSFLVAWYSTSFSMGLQDMGLFGLVFFLFPLIHVVVGFVVLYQALCGLLNKTTLTLRFNQASTGDAPFRDSALKAGLLTITHGPIPKGGRVEIATDNISQLYCSEHTQKSKNGVSRSMHLNAMLRDGEMKVLIKDIDSLGTARYLEQQIEARLGIDDRPIQGEASK